VARLYPTRVRVSGPGECCMRAVPLAPRVSLCSHGWPVSDAERPPSAVRPERRGDVRPRARPPSCTRVCGLGARTRCALAASCGCCASRAGGQGGRPGPPIHVRPIGIDAQPPCAVAPRAFRPCRVDNRRYAPAASSSEGSHILVRWHGDDGAADPRGPSATGAPALGQCCPGLGMAGARAGECPSHPRQHRGAHEARAERRVRVNRSTHHRR